MMEFSVWDALRAGSRVATVTDAGTVLIAVRRRWLLRGWCVRGSWCGYARRNSRAAWASRTSETSS